MPLRDFASFEDLTNELDVDITEVSIVDTDIDKGPIKRRARPKLQFRVTPASYKEVKDYPESMTHAAVSRQMKKLHPSEPTKVPSEQTVSNIRKGVIKEPVFWDDNTPGGSR